MIPEGAPEPDDILGPWLGSELKVQVLAFYHNNPGLIETVEGLARRLGVSQDALAAAIEDHVELGLLRERQAGDKTVLVYDRGREQDVQRRILDRVDQLRRGVGS